MSFSGAERMRPNAYIMDNDVASMYPSQMVGRVMRFDLESTGGLEPVFTDEYKPRIQIMSTPTGGDHWMYKYLTDVDKKETNHFENEEDLFEI